jgi:hypothetical protein
MEPEENWRIIVLVYPCVVVVARWRNVFPKLAIVPWLQVVCDTTLCGHRPYILILKGNGSAASSNCASFLKNNAGEPAAGGRPWRMGRAT